MKKIISIALTCVMLLSLASTSVFALQVEDYAYILTATAEDGKSTKDIKAGDVITLTVTVPTSEGLSSADIVLQYDPDLFDCVAPTLRGSSISKYNALSEAWYKEYMTLHEYARINSGTCSFPWNEATGIAGIMGTVKDGENVWPEDAVENLTLFECMLTAEQDITEETTISFTNATYIGAFINGKTTSIPWSDSITIGGVAATPTPTATPTAEPTATPTAEPTATPTAEPTATPTVAPTATPTAEPTATPTAEPTATPTAAPTAAPELINTAATENVLTTAEVADKAFTAFAKIANIAVADVAEFGIKFVAGDAAVTEDAAKAGTAYVAEGALADGSFSVRLINGEGEVDYFEAAYAGFIPYMVVNGVEYYGAFTTLK